jgi:hypothetical protein
MARMAIGCAGQHGDKTPPRSAQRESVIETTAAVGTVGGRVAVELTNAAAVSIVETST